MWRLTRIAVTVAAVVGSAVACGGEQGAMTTVPSVLDLGDPVAEVVEVTAPLETTASPGTTAPPGTTDPDAVAAVAVVSEVVDAANAGDRERVTAMADPRLVDGIMHLPGGVDGLEVDGVIASPSDEPGTWEVVIGSAVGWSWVAEVTRAEDGAWRVVGVHAIGGGM